ncbi:EI24 domain-containing protein [Jonesia quinghaiensis]|uniref:EI24 domain-containing protein n=1 Tax=Jonesia quinghaiensis TaxID=262806 RepID=UPI00041A56CE|nr:EI24 domain-containing protein [Jonesia quinghaiensis]
MPAPIDPQAAAKNAQDITLRVRDGAFYLMEGMRWLLKRPKLLILGMMPAALVTLILLALLIVLLVNIVPITLFLTPFAQDWATGWMWTVRIVAAIGVLGLALGLSAALFTALALMIGDPIYQKIWEEVERDIHGKVPDQEPGFFQGIKDGWALAWRSVLFAMGCMIISIIPIVGPAVAGTLNLSAAAWLLTLETASRSLTAHGVPEKDRRGCLRKQTPMTLGFGFTISGVYTIPLGAILFMPAVVVGSTMLAHRIMELSGYQPPAPIDKNPPPIPGMINL